jgi:hypothetical protein
MTIGIFVGLAAILLGLKGFTPAGLPLTSKKRLTGTTAKVLGALCLLIGLAFIADGVYSLYTLTHQGP